MKAAQAHGLVEASLKRAVAAHLMRADLNPRVRREDRDPVDDTGRSAAFARFADHCGAQWRKPELGALLRAVACGVVTRTGECLMPMAIIAVALDWQAAEILDLAVSNGHLLRLSEGVVRAPQRAGEPALRLTPAGWSWVHGEFTPFWGWARRVAAAWGEAPEAFLEERPRFAGSLVWEPRTGTRRVEVRRWTASGVMEALRDIECELPRVRLYDCSFGEVQHLTSGSYLWHAAGLTDEPKAEQVCYTQKGGDHEWVMATNPVVARLPGSVVLGCMNIRCDSIAVSSNAEVVALVLMAGSRVSGIIVSRTSLQLTEAANLESSGPQRGTMPAGPGRVSAWGSGRTTAADVAAQFRAGTCGSSGAPTGAEHRGPAEHRRVESS